MHEAQLELRSQKNNSILQISFRNLQFKVKQSKRNSIQCFSETLIGKHVLKTLRHSLQQDPHVDFGVDFINSEKTLFYLHIKKKMNEEAVFFGCVFSFAKRVPCLLAYLAVLSRANFGSCILNAPLKQCFLKQWRKAHFCRLRWGKFPDMKLKIGKFHADFRFYHIYR